VTLEFTDEEWSELVGLYYRLQHLIGEDEQYPTVTQDEYDELVESLQDTIDSLILDRTE
jgi:hypothetical protein